MANTSRGPKPSKPKRSIGPGSPGYKGSNIIRLGRTSKTREKVIELTPAQQFAESGGTGFITAQGVEAYRLAGKPFDVVPHEVPGLFRLTTPEERAARQQRQIAAAPTAQTPIVTDTLASREERAPVSEQTITQPARQDPVISTRTPELTAKQKTSLGVGTVAVVLLAIVAIALSRGKKVGLR